MPPARTHLEAAAAGVIYCLHLGSVVNDLAAGRKIRSRHSGENITFRILKELDRSLTHFAEIEAANLAGHADGYAGVSGHQHVRESGRQKRGLLHAAVVVVGEFNGILVDIPEHLGAYGRELGLRITGGGKGHIA